jgi:Ulp1 family protease
MTRKKNKRKSPEEEDEEEYAESVYEGFFVCWDKKWLFEDELWIFDKGMRDMAYQGLNDLDAEIAKKKRKKDKQAKAQAKAVKSQGHAHSYETRKGVSNNIVVDGSDISNNKALVEDIQVLSESSIGLLHDTKSWYDEAIITNYFNFIQHRARTEGGLVVGVLSTYAVVKFQPAESDPERMKRWLHKQHLDFEKLHILLAPIHIYGNHWFLLECNFQSCQFKFYDALYGKPTSEHLAAYAVVRDMIIHATNTCTRSFGNMKNWPRLVPGIPDQTNDYDCGPFVCEFADRIFQEVKTCISQMRTCVIFVKELKKHC